MTPSGIMNKSPMRAEVTKSAPGPFGATYPICDDIPNKVGPVTARLRINASSQLNERTRPVAFLTNAVFPEEVVANFLIPVAREKPSELLILCRSVQNYANLERLIGRRACICSRHYPLWNPFLPHHEKLIGFSNAGIYWQVEGKESDSHGRQQGNRGCDCYPVRRRGCRYNPELQQLRGKSGEANQIT